MTPEEYIREQIAQNVTEIKFWLLEPKHTVLPENISQRELEQCVSHTIAHLTKTEIEIQICNSDIYDYRAERYEFVGDDLEEIRELEGGEIESWIANHYDRAVEVICAYDLLLDEMYDNLAQIYYNADTIAQNMIARGDNDDISLEDLTEMIRGYCETDPSQIASLAGYKFARWVINQYGGYL